MRYLILTIIIVSVIMLFASIPSADEPAMSIGPRFHFETGFGDNGIKSDAIGFGSPQPEFKQYDDSLLRIKLTVPEIPAANLGDLIVIRRSVRHFAAQSLSLEQISRMLLSAYGLTSNRGGYAHHSIPSGGALYPMEIYLIASHVEGLTEGLYHFQTRDSSLILLKKGDFNKQLHAASNKQESVGNSPAAIVITSRFERMTQKYADRGYRYIYMEAGAICQNIYLQAAELGLGTVAVGAFNDDRLNALLEIDGTHEAGLLIMPLGVPE